MSFNNSSFRTGVAFFLGCLTGIVLVAIVMSGATLFYLARQQTPAAPSAAPIPVAAQKKCGDNAVYFDNAISAVEKFVTAEERILDALNSRPPSIPKTEVAKLRAAKTLFESKPIPPCAAKYHATTLEGMNLAISALSAETITATSTNMLRVSAEKWKEAAAELDRIKASGE